MGLILLVFFLFWPLGVVWFSLVNYNAKWTKNILWLFIIFYGYTFVLSNDTMDANRIKEKFDTLAYFNFNFNDFISYYFIENSNAIDILQPVIFYVTSKFTSDFNILMAILAAILGFFYSRNLSYLLDKSNSKIKITSFVFLWMFMSVIGFWEINAFRFWTASLMFFYAVIPSVYENDNKKLWIVLLACILHFSFLFPLAVLLCFKIFKNKSSLYFWFFVCSFLFTLLNVGMIGDFMLKIFPSNFHNKISAYASESRVEELAENVRSISSYLRFFMFIIINGFFILFYFSYKNLIKDDDKLYSLFNFCLLFLGAANFISIIPSGGRFLLLSALFALTFIFLFLQKNSLKGNLKVYLYMSTPFLLLASIGFIRLGLNTIGVLTVFGNPIIAFFMKSKIALIELLPFL